VHTLSSEVFIGIWILCAIGAVVDRRQDKIRFVQAFSFLLAGVGEFFESSMPFLGEIFDGGCVLVMLLYLALNRRASRET
jgi:hypothetical protein